MTKHEYLDERYDIEYDESITYDDYVDALLILDNVKDDLDYAIYSRLKALLKNQHTYTEQDLLYALKLIAEYIHSSTLYKYC